MAMIVVSIANFEIEESNMNANTVQTTDKIQISLEMFKSNILKSLKGRIISKKHKKQKETNMLIPA